jgi:hypothetical protein
MRKYHYKDSKSTLVEHALMEIDFSSRWELLTNTDVTNHVHSELMNQHPYNELTVYQKADDPTQIILTMFIDQYFEVHHARHNSETNLYVSGYKFGASDSSIGFLSTAVSLYLNALDRGWPVKISTVNKKFWRSYNRIIQNIASKSGNYYVGSENVVQDQNNETTYSRVIIPKSKLPIDYRMKLIKELQA